MDGIGNVLIVTTSETVATLCRAALNSIEAGKAMRVPGRVEALQTIAAGWPELIVIDWSLADASIIAAAARTAGIRFLTLNDDERSALAGGALACIPRPFTSRHLRDVLLPAHVS